MEKKIIQIMPAEGWKAVHAARGEDGGIELSEETLVCWALVETPPSPDEEELFREVVGMVAESYVEAAEEFESFVAYLAPGENSDRFHRAAERHLELEDKRQREMGLLHEAGYECRRDTFGAERWLGPDNRWRSRREALEAVRSEEAS